MSDFRSLYFVLTKLIKCQVIFRFSHEPEGPTITCLSTNSRHLLSHLKKILLTRVSTSYRDPGNEAVGKDLAGIILKMGVTKD